MCASVAPSVLRSAAQRPQRCARCAAPSPLRTEPLTHGAAVFPQHLACPLPPRQSTATAPNHPPAASAERAGLRAERHSCFCSR